MAEKFKQVTPYFEVGQVVSESMRCFCAPGMEKCRQECPVRVDVNGFINILKKLKAEATIEEIDMIMYTAFKKIREENPMPEICGLVCPQEKQCQKTCVRGTIPDKDGKKRPVDIGKLEAFTSMWIRKNIDRISKYDWFENVRICEKKQGKVLVVGSGPAGLNCAADLALMGYEIEIVESLHDTGGVLRYGIPEFRLPKAIVDYEIEQILGSGVKIKLNHTIKNIQEYMQDNNFDAAFLGTGAGTPYELTNHKNEIVPGQRLKGVYSANEFLTRVNLMKSYLFPEYKTPPPKVLGKKVVVFGGSNVAMDAARTALRLGAKEVVVMYRRTEEEIPARAEEFENAKKEGVKFMYLITPLEFKGNEKNWLSKVVYIKNILGEPDLSGRRRPVPIEDEKYEYDADVAVIAIGKGPNLTLDTSMFKTDKEGRFVVDSKTRGTSLPRVFAGGDNSATIRDGRAIKDGGTVILAAGFGRKAAKAIDEYLRKSK